jgi:hypothetical protein
MTPTQKIMACFPLAGHRFPLDRTPQGVSREPTEEEARVYARPFPRAVFAVTPSCLPTRGRWPRYLKQSVQEFRATRDDNFHIIRGGDE